MSTPDPDAPDMATSLLSLSQQTAPVYDAADGILSAADQPISGWW